MPENLLSSKNIAIGIATITVLVGGGYYGYTVAFQDQTSVAPSSNVNISLLEPNVKTFLSVKDSISFKDVAFKKSKLYEQLMDYSETIPDTTERGRDYPFTPYVITGPIR